MPSQTNDESRRYIVGGMAEMRLTGGFAVEVDFLYRHLGDTQYSKFGTFVPQSTSQQVVETVLVRSRSDVFELPILGKYYFRRDQRIQPFAVTGYALRKAQTADDSIAELFSVERGRERQVGQSSRWLPLEVGVVVGGGVRWRAGRVWFTPEIRYSHFGGIRTPETSRNQTDLLLGITF